MQRITHRGVCFRKHIHYTVLICPCCGGSEAIHEHYFHNRRSNVAARGRAEDAVGKTREISPALKPTLSSQAPTAGTWRNEVGLRMSWAASCLNCLSSRVSDKALHDKVTVATRALAVGDRVAVDIVRQIITCLSLHCSYGS